MEQRGSLDLNGVQKSPQEKGSLQPNNADLYGGIKVALAPQGYGGGIPPKIDEDIEPPETKPRIVTQ